MKRDDLQGIRGVAVLLVLIFHLIPTRFPLGFVGVDMFFVLSGFLMSNILSRNPISLLVVSDFYQRRFRRIVPLFFVVCVLIYLGCYIIVIKSDREDILTDLKWAVTFTSNMQPIYESKGYWDQISSYRFFLHAWSLGVELQFYIIAPILLGATNRWNKNYRCTLLILLSCASVTLQLFSPSNVSYGLMFCRIWQFLLGSLAFECTDHSISEKVYNNLSNLPQVCDLILVTMWSVVMVNPPYINQITMRLIGTSATALMIYLSGKYQSRLLTTRFLVYMGDVSYSLYLLHWPLIVGTKYYLNENPLRLEVVVMLFVGTIIAAVMFHEFVEKNLIHCETKTSLIVVLLCLFTILLTSPYYPTTQLNIGGTNEQSIKINITAAIQWNTREGKKVYFSLPCSPDKEVLKLTNIKKEMGMRCYKKGSGKLKILVLGNSIAYRAFPLLHNILKNRYSELRLFSISTCVPLYNDCLYFTNASHLVVDKMKPDILINIWLTKSKDLLGPVTNLANDTTLRIMQKNLDYYSKRSKHVVIDMPYYFLDKGRVGYEVSKRLQQNIPLTDLRRTKQEDFEQQQFHRARVEHLKCSNCIINRVDEALFEGEFLYLYNRSSLHAYYGDGTHLTPEGLELVRPKYEEVLEPLLKNK